jgi:5'(3')-deoxyribonucleotidase
VTAKPIILCDIDGIIVNFTAAYLELVERTTGRVHREHEIHSFNFHESIVSKGEDLAIWKHIASTPGFVHALPLYKDALDFLEVLRSLGRVVACTSPASPLWTAERAQWLREVARFDRRDIVVTNDKSLIYGDYLIDDHYDNIQAWEGAPQNSRDGVGLLFRRPWNFKHEHHTTAYVYQDVLDLIDESEAR